MFLVYIIAILYNYYVIVGTMIIESTIEDVLSTVVDEGQLGGAATLICRGDSVRVACAGVRDLESRLPIERNTISALPR